MQDPEQASSCFQQFSRLFQIDVICYKRALTIQMQMNRDWEREVYNQVNKRKTY